jgi:prepilin-type N-terminal cleavage/methylation domain-containing protein
MVKRLPIRRPARRAFTLLELLVALGLSVLLIAAVYSGINLYWKYSVAGQEEVQRLQVARAALRAIELDLRSVVYHAPDTPGTSSSGSSGSSSSGSSSGFSGSGSSGSASSSTSTDMRVVSSTEQAYTTATSGLFGDATSLMLHVSQPARELSTPAAGDPLGPTSRTSDLVMVSYYLSGTGTGGIQGNLPASGLARTRGDRMAMMFAGPQSNTATGFGEPELLAPEIVGLRFLYYDGLNWLTEWDSTLLGGLPRAVQIELEFAPPETTVSETNTPLTQTLTVALPLSRPVDTSLLIP